MNARRLAAIVIPTVSDALLDAECQHLPGCLFAVVTPSCSYDSLALAGLGLHGKGCGAAVRATHWPVGYFGMRARVAVGQYVAHLFDSFVCRTF
jgi:hypothetical protein